MSYVLPKDLSNNFKVSIQTIYNHLKKHWKSIRTKKEGVKTYINQEDFKTIFQQRFKSFENDFKEESSKPGNKDFKILNEDFKALENKQIILESERDGLEKYNLALQDQVSKYALLFKEEKDEKQQIITKHDKQQKEATARHDELQQELRTTIERFGRERVKRAMKFYLAVGIGGVLLVLFLLVVFPLVKNWF